MSTLNMIPLQRVPPDLTFALLLILPGVSADYQIPPVSCMQQPAGSVSSSSFINEYLPIILPVIACAVIISALVGFIFYQHHQTACWCPINREIPVTTHAVQATVVDSERIPMNTNTDEFFNV
ncbi:hypothetical protein ACJMK2_009691 [Sinanodonta woodiana]|uniref:Uncharacterized protein n=1 Tax=Sinanodonta woodiana TaxID=1069815 RepID=A0ABD3VEL8_SINWO